MTSPLLQDCVGARRVTALELLGGRTALAVVAPHPDDETLGCGALLHEASALGIDCTVVCVTDGGASHPNSAQWGGRLGELRRSEFHAALGRLSPRLKPKWLGYPDCGLPVEGPARAAAASALSAVLPKGALVAVTWSGDPHVDHERCNAIAREVVAARPDLRLIEYPIWGRFDPGATVPQGSLRLLSAPPAARDAKRLALACHASQMTRLIDDDPDGFVMTAEHQAHFLETPEIFLAA